MKKTYGLYEINKVHVVSDRDYYRDILILSTVETDAAVLKTNAKDTRVKCCYTIDGGSGLDKHLTGFARIFTYADSLGGGKTPQWLDMLYEGELALGVPSGFGRKIDARSKLSFIGYLRNWNDTKQAPTLGLLFENFKL